MPRARFFYPLIGLCVLMCGCAGLPREAREARGTPALTLERVRIARLCVEYAWVDRHRMHPGPDFPARAKRFFETARRAKVTWIDKSTTTLDKYEAQIQAELDKKGEGKS